MYLMNSIRTRYNKILTYPEKIIESLQSYLVMPASKISANSNKS